MYNQPVQPIYSQSVNDAAPQSDAFKEFGQSEEIKDFNFDEPKDETFASHVPVQPTVVPKDLLDIFGNQPST